MKEADNINKDLILREKLALQRTVLANQSTFLAFLRTSMYFLIAGLSIDNLLNIHKGELYKAVLFSVSAILLVAGIVNYFINRSKILDSEKHIGSYKTEFEQ
nr:DUF202 domain-containing protein [uncultured Lacibacter sp.]